MAASTVAQYLAALPADRRAAFSAVRKAINENLPEGYEEGMQFGMIGWYVPLSMYPAGYGENPKVPLSFVALASQKSGMVLHFLCCYGHPTLSNSIVIFTALLLFFHKCHRLDKKPACRYQSWLTFFLRIDASPYRSDSIETPWHSQQR